MFRLDKVLHHRELLEKEARAERAEAERRANALEGAIESVRRERGSCPEDVGEGEPEAVVTELAQWSRYAEGLRRRERGLEQRLAAIRPKLEERIRAHQEIRKEVEGLRKLRARHLARRRRLRERKGQEAIDDAASRRRIPGPGTEFPKMTEPGHRGHSAETAGEPAGTDRNPDRGTGR